MQTIHFQTADGKNLATATVDGDGTVVFTTISKGFRIVSSWPNEEDEIHNHEDDEI